jgi:hypothetical protein
MSDKLQFVVATDKLKLVGHETDPVLSGITLEFAGRFKRQT